MKSTVLLFFLILIFIVGCQKDDLTKPVRVAFRFSMNDSIDNKDNGNVTFHSGEMNVLQISFEGYRESGEDIFFDSDFSSIIHANLENEITEPLVVFDIPQGIYEHINIRLKIDTLETGLSLRIIGTYQSPNPKKGDIEVIFTYEFPDIIDLDPKPAKGSEKIVFSTDKENVVKIVLDTKFLFLLLNTSMLEAADITMDDGKKLILISSEENEHIYHVISNRIEKSMQAWCY